MKKLLMLVTALAILQICYAQSTGIGTASPHPSALLHVHLGASTSQGLLVTGTFNAASSVPNLSGGSRLMFFPAKSAFRAGYAFSNQWDDANVGLNSFAAGNSSIASGVSATAIGYYNIARGYASTVLGMFNAPVIAAAETNISATSPLFIVGNGNTDNERSNALLVRKDGNIGMGTDNPAAKLAIVQANNAEGISVSLPNGANASRGISVQTSGVGPGVFASSAGGNALWGVTSSISAAGVIGDNTYGEAVVGRNRGGNGVGAVVGRNDSAGYGVRGFNTKMGIGVLGQSGISGGTGIAGKFENVSAANPSNALEAKTNGTGRAGLIEIANPNNNSNALEAKTNGTGAAAFFTNSSTGPALVTGNGKVGIAVAAPEYVLDVKGRIRLASGGDLANSPGMWINNIDNTGQLGFWGAYDNNYFGWYGTGGASWNLLMNINNGFIGIGTQNPTQKLHVNGSICYTGSIAACSDIRYKKNIVPLQNVLNELMSLHAIYYNWDKEKFTDKAFNEERQLGFSAQEIKKLFPEIVQTDSEGYMAVDYSRLTPVLVEAMKEQQSQIATQQQQISQLNAQNKELMSRLSRLESLVWRQ
jgi:hypothetical protein